MTTLEQVEKLRERANVSFEEAKAALDQSGGDLLDALILLERQGKTDSPKAGGFYSGEEAAAEEPKCEKRAKKEKRYHCETEGFKSAMMKLGTFLLRIINAGNNNHIDAVRNGSVVFSCPITVFVILLIVAFWAVVPLIIISMFFSWRYVLRGPNLGRDSINNAIATAEDAVEELKNNVAQNAKAAAERKNENNDMGN